MAGNKTNKELAFEGIKGLVEKFENNYKQFHASDYNETLTRQDFINPFFEYLGWDISNKQGYSQTYREVIHEDKLKIGKETKAPDYSFRIGGNRVFFVEAKKPSLNLKEDSDAAYQVKRYAWSGKLAVSILTDFEEFAIYDCSKKPSPNDKASMSRIEYINYKDYLNRFDFLYDTFAKENVLKGSLEKYNAETKNKKGTESVDIDFLNSLDNLRTKLASSISKLNSLSERDLNFAVQHIIDRIIFLRVAEDRGVENYGDLREACSNSYVIPSGTKESNNRRIASAMPRNDNKIETYNDNKIETYNDNKVEAYDDNKVEAYDDNKVKDCHASLREARNDDGVSRHSPKASHWNEDKVRSNLNNMDCFTTVRNDNEVDVRNDNKVEVRNDNDGNNYYKNIVEIFKKADGKYNSGIFDFRKDLVTQDIKV